MLPSRLLVLLGVLVLCLQVATAARPAPAPVPAEGPRQHLDVAAGRTFKHLQDARRGSHIAGLADLKRYLARFRYMQPRPAHDDAFDEHMEVAVKRYQSRFGLPVTGQLDSATLGRIMTPRCGVADGGKGHVHGGGGLSVLLSEKAAAKARFTFFDGEPRWTVAEHLVLTYAISPKDTVDYLAPEVLRDVFRSAFARWARVIPVEFVETDYYGEPDITIGFYSGDHGDGYPFHGELAHAEQPTYGWIHFNAAEDWAVDMDSDRRAFAVDLESVATHEIGHALGLEHSSTPGAVMYPYINYRERKVELSKDDIEGIQLLYGSNPRFKHHSRTGRSNSIARSVSLVCVALFMLVTHL